MVAPRTRAWEICILAGGLSERLGRDKASLVLGKRTMLSLIRSTAAATGLPVRIIRKDIVPRCGPLGGIYTALRTTRGEAVLFLACDMPFITTELLIRILSNLTSRYQACFALARSKVCFPFVLRRTVLGQVLQHIERKQYSLQSLAKIPRTKLVRLTPLVMPQLSNINTPADWILARRRWSETRGCVLVRGRRANSP